MYTLNRTVEPTALPVELARVKRYLRISNDQHDEELLNLFIPSAVDLCEAETNRQFCTATYQLGLRHWPGTLWGTVYSTSHQRLYLPKGRLQSVTSATYSDSAGSTQTFSSSLYSVNTAHEPGYIQATTWPQDTDTVNRDHPITITYVCGYGSSAASVPVGLQNAILMAVKDLFDDRGDNEKVSWAASRLLMKYKLGDCFEDYGLCQ